MIGRGLPFGRGLAQSGPMDLKFAIRSLFRNPGFALLSILVMALGIGANTAVFSVVNTVLLKPLAFPEPDRIVTLSNLWTKQATVSANVSGPDFHDWHDQSTAFEAMAYYLNGPEPVGLPSGTEYGQAAAVTPEFLRVFGVQPVVGRGFTAEETKAGGPDAALISDAFRQRHFENTDAVGKSVRMEGHTFTIVGVMPPRFHFPGKTDLWTPANTIDKETVSRSAHNYRVVGRLAPGSTLEQAQAQLTAIATRLEQQYPESNKGKSAVVQLMLDNMVSNVRLTLYLLLGAVVLVQLIACANVANLLLAKAMSRSREIAIRAAVGAARWRIVRQLTVESLVLAMLAGIAGLFLALWGVDAIRAVAPRNIPRVGDISVDGVVLAFTLAVSVLSSLLFGLAPALQASKVDLNDALKQGAAKGVMSGGANRMRSALVVGEIALSVVLLTGAGLLIRSFQALSNVELGFRPQSILMVKASVPSSGLAGAQRATRFYRDLMGDIRALPGVTGAGASAGPPGTIRSNGGYWVDHLPEKPGINSPQAVFSVIMPGTFATLGIPLLSGHDLTDGDTYDSPFFAVINEELARRSFPGENPIGHVLFCGMDSPKPMTIVGVVGNVRQWGPATAPWPEIYMPYQQHPYFATVLHLLVRTSGDPGSLTEAVRRTIRARSPEVPVQFTTLEASLSESVAAPRFRTLLLAIFAGLAVLLAMAGVYGVMAYVVTQRTNEIGLRLALGASGGNILRLVVGQGLLLTIAGLAIGLAGAVAATRLLTSMLFEIKPGDPATYAAASALLAVVALAACYLPARRAMKVDPLVALRQE
jgi:putative ABC transport system permease protein